MQIPTITARKDPRGGDVAPQASANFALTSSRLILLIHGYNNNEEEALKSYGAFLQNSGLAKASAIGTACGFLWPGDKGGMLAMFSYPWEIKSARGSAEVLHTFLAAQKTPGGWPLEIMLVCHSLGNRVGLELVKQCCTNGGFDRIRYRAGCFMAAAVPVFKVEEGGDLRDAALAVQRKAVLYSEDDIVLHFAFPVGQTLAGDGEGSFPTAIGRFGQPSSGVWNQSNNMGWFRYNHSHYWSRQESADIAAAFLGLAKARETAAAVLPEREMQDPLKRTERSIPTRTLSVRQMPA